ncbi:hypothetical protein ACJX0J_031969, partial [Zea mays]
TSDMIAAVNYCSLISRHRLTTDLLAGMHSFNIVGLMLDFLLTFLDTKVINDGDIELFVFFFRSAFAKGPKNNKFYLFFLVCLKNNEVSFILMTHVGMRR